MRRLLPLLALIFAGCSNAPVAGFLDCISPSKARPGLRDRPPAGGEWAIPEPRGRDLPPPGIVPPPADSR